MCGLNNCKEFKEKSLKQKLQEEQGIIDCYV